MPITNQENNPENVPNPHTGGTINDGSSNIQPDESGNQTVRSRQRRNQQAAKPKKVIVDITSIPFTENIEGKSANRISLISNFVNTGLLLCTIILAIISLNQSKSAERAVNIADSTFKADTAYNGRTYRQARKDAAENNTREDRRDERSKINIGIQDSALRAQIKAIKENENFYRIDHQPYLVFTQDTISLQLRGDEKIELNYIIKGLSARPIEGYGSYVFFVTFPIEDTVRILNKFRNSILWVNEEKPYYYGNLARKKATMIDEGNVIRQKFINGKICFLLGGRIKYINYITNSFRYYDFFIQVENKIDGFQYKLIINKNYDTLDMSPHKKPE